jgi:hypothetical protein
MKLLVADENGVREIRYNLTGVYQLSSFDTFMAYARCTKEEKDDWEADEYLCLMYDEEADALLEESGVDVKGKKFKIGDKAVITMTGEVIRVVDYDPPTKEYKYFPEDRISTLGEWIKQDLLESLEEGKQP